MSIETGVVWDERKDGSDIWETEYAGLKLSLDRTEKEMVVYGFEDAQDAKLFAEACLRLRMEQKGTTLQKVLGDAETADRVLALVDRMSDGEFEQFGLALRNARK